MLSLQREQRTLSIPTPNEAADLSRIAAIVDSASDRPVGPDLGLRGRIRQVCQGTKSTGSWPLEHPVAGMIIWSVVIIGICAPFALQRFKTTSAAR